jgi:hypothetical protein
MDHDLWVGITLGRVYRRNQHEVCGSPYPASLHLSFFPLTSGRREAATSAGPDHERTYFHDRFQLYHDSRFA